jgi:HMG (high mobility group) box
LQIIFHHHPQTGNGLRLSEYPYFLKGLEKLKGDDEIVKSLHSLLFSSVSKKLEGKKNIRLFNGFADEKTKNEKLSKVAENKKKWTVQLLKDVLGLFGMEKTGTRTELVEKLMDYLMSPTAIKDESNGTAPKRKTAKSASTKAVATKGTKRKATNDGKAPKKARAPSAYILFSVDARIDIKKTNPDATFAEIGALVGKKWSSVDEDEKKVRMMHEQYRAASRSTQNPNFETLSLRNGLT